MVICRARIKQKLQINMVRIKCCYGEEVTKLRAANQPTVPTLIRDEKEANVFLRADVPSVAAAVGLAGKSPVEVFGELRERKNKS